MPQLDDLQKMKKSKIISIGGAIVLTFFFIGYHTQKNEEKAQARERAHQAHQEYISEKAKWDELQRKSQEMQASIKATTDKVMNMKIPTYKTEQVLSQSAKEKKGHYFAEHQRKINQLPRDLGGGIVYVNCTYEEDGNILIFHYMLSFDFKGNVSAEDYHTMIQQMKRTPDWEETASFGFTDIQAYWNMPTRLVRYSLLNEKWL